LNAWISAKRNYAKRNLPGEVCILTTQIGSEYTNQGLGSNYQTTNYKLPYNVSLGNYNIPQGYEPSEFILSLIGYADQVTSFNKSVWFNHSTNKRRTLIYN